MATSVFSILERKRKNQNVSAPSRGKKEAGQRLTVQQCDIHSKTGASTDTNEVKLTENNFESSKQPMSPIDNENPNLIKQHLKTGYHKMKIHHFLQTFCKSDLSSSAQSDQLYIKATHLPKRIQFHTHHLDKEISPASEMGSDKVDTKRAADGGTVKKKNIQSECRVYSKAAEKDACKDAKVTLAFCSKRLEKQQDRNYKCEHFFYQCCQPCQKNDYHEATTYTPTAEYSAASLSQAKPLEVVQANNKSANVQDTSYSGLTPRNTVSANAQVSVQSHAGRETKLYDLRPN